MRVLFRRENLWYLKIHSMVPMQRRSKLVFSLIVSLAISPGLLAQTFESTRITEYSAVRLSYDNLSRILMKIQRFVEKANENEHCNSVGEHLTVDDGVLSIELRGDYSRTAFSGAPETAYSVYFYYDGCTQAPISSVTLSLWDGTRRLAVTGHSSDQVQALTTLATEDITQFESDFGGVWFRLIGLLLLLTIAIAFFCFPAVLTTRLRKYISIGFGLAIFLSLFVCPWSKWFPGTAVYSGSASFLLRNGPIISFLGLVATVVTFIVGIWWPRLSANPPAPIPPPRTVRSSQTRTK